MKVFLRGLVFLSLLFVVLYIGMTNTHSISFYFPLLLDAKKVSQPAAMLFYAMFAAGVVAGMMLRSEPEKSSGSGESRKKK